MMWLSRAENQLKFGTKSDKQRVFPGIGGVAMLASLLAMAVLAPKPFETWTPCRSLPEMGGGIDEYPTTGIKGGTEFVVKGHATDKDTYINETAEMMQLPSHSHKLVDINIKSGTVVGEDMPKEEDGVRTFHFTIKAITDLGGEAYVLRTDEYAVVDEVEDGRLKDVNLFNLTYTVKIIPGETPTAGGGVGAG